jgi:DNA-binding NarL/FixJ family response regulator
MRRAARIVLVDDDDVLREMAHALLSRVFDDIDPEVVEAGTAGDAYQLFLAERPDVIVLDLNLPDASGLDVLRQITATADHPPVIAWSSDPFALRRAMNFGAAAALDKAEDIQGLIDAIADCLSRTEQAG